MFEFVATFETITGGVLAAVFVTLFIIETRCPLRQAKRPKTRRFAINVAVSGLALVIGGYIVAPVAVSLSARSTEISFGLLHAVPLAGKNRIELVHNGAETTKWMPVAKQKQKN
jgi:hypothetical protein